MATIRPVPPTIEDIQHLARQFGVRFTFHRDSFDLDKREPRLSGTYRNNQAGINAAYSVLIRHGWLMREGGPVSDPIWPEWKQHPLLTAAGWLSFAASLFVLFMLIFHFWLHLI